jgi:RHS repeat-associated protein
MFEAVVLAAALSISQVTTYQYDELGRVISVSGQGGRVLSSFAYDADGRILQQKNGNSESAVLAYDALGRLSTATDAKGGVTKFHYDAADQLIRVEDPKGLSTAYRYNGFGDLIELNSPDSGRTTYMRRADGRAVQVGRADGSSLTYEHDALGRVMKIAGGNEERTFTYDTCGKSFLCEQRSAASGVSRTATSFIYSNNGILLRRTDVTPTSQDVTQYQYDGLGRVSSVAYPSGVSLGYGYTLGRLTAISAVVDGIAHPVIGNVRYQPFGGPESWIYGNGLTRRYSLDADGRTFGVSASKEDSTAQSLTYAFDAASRIKAITNGGGTPVSQQFAYDASGRLISDAISGQSGHDLINSFDGNGNRTKHGWNGEFETHAIESQSNRLLSVAGTSNASRHHEYAYSLQGNLIRDTVRGVHTGFQYDPFGRLSLVGRMESVQVCEPYGSCRTLPAGETRYVVNAADQQVARTRAGSTTRYVYGSQSQRVAEYSEAGWRTYIWFGNELVGLVTPSNGAIVAWYEDYPITIGHAGVKFVHSDHLGRPEVVTNSHAVPVWRAANFAFDRKVSLDLIDGLSLGFLGQYYDEDNDLWSNGFRYYDAKVGRYIQSDPIGLAGGINPYSYVGGDPVNYVDPLGLDREIIFWAPILRSPGSWFGHVSSVDGDGGNNSFGTHGWDKTYPTAKEYISRQNSRQGPNRSGTGLVVGLTPLQDKLFDACMAGKRLDNHPYNGFSNNCTTAAQQCLNFVGVSVPESSVFPQDFQDALWSSGSVVDVYGYPAE